MRTLRAVAPLAQMLTRTRARTRTLAQTLAPTCARTLAWPPRLRPLALLLTAIACAEPSTAPARPAESAAATWRTLVLPGADALRPAAPPAESSAQTQQEIDEIVALQRSATAPADSVIARFDGDPTSLWTRTAVDLLGVYWTILPDVRIATPARSARLMALLHAATYDAVVATWDAKWAYKRRAPSEVSSRVRARGTPSGVPSYPSEHAAVAAAAFEVLAATALPGDTAALRRLMREAGETRIAAGAAYRSDVEAGYALGRGVARRVLQWAATDGSDRVWDGVRPTGAYVWRPTPARRVQVPFDALAGSWKTWVIPSGSAYRPLPYPAPGSAGFQASLDELRRLAAGGRTIAQMDRARYWATEAPTARWDLFVEEELGKRRWSLPRSARARAWASIAMYDAFVACWDAKFHYWLARPITVDSTINTVFSTPPFPSYPSGHSTISSAVAEVLGVLFPDKAKVWDDYASEASNSRVWAGVHYRFDIEAGETLGAAVGKAVVTRMQEDGVK